MRPGRGPLPAALLALAAALCTWWLLAPPRQGSTSAIPQPRAEASARNELEGVREAPRSRREAPAPSGPRGPSGTGATLAIRVLSDPGSGDPEPAPGMRMRIRRIGGGEPLEQSSSARGGFRWEDIEPGEYQLQLIGIEQGRTTLRPGEVKEFDWLLQAVERVPGRVLDQAGFPVPEASIWLSSGNSSLEGDFVSTTAADGAFLVRIGARPRLVGAWKQGLGSSGLVPLATAERPVVLELSTRSGSLGGTCRARSGEPLAQVSVEVRPLDLGTTHQGRRRAPVVGTTTDSRGSYEVSGLLAGTHEVHFRAPGFGYRAVPVGVRDGAISTCDVTLLEAGRVVGRVVGPEGAPVEGALVSLGTPLRPFCQTVLTGPEGDFVLDAFAEGSRRLMVHQRPSQGQRAPQPVMVEVLPGATVDVGDIALSVDTRRTVHGAVDPPSPGEGGPWQVRITGGAWSSVATADGSGLFALDDWRGPLFDLEVSLLASDLGPWPVHRVGGRRVDAEGGSIGTIHVPRQVLQGCAVRGRVLDPHGDPVQATVSLHPLSESRLAQATTDADGRFSLRGPAQRELSLYVTTSSSRQSHFLGAPGVPELDLGDLLVGGGGRLRIENSGSAAAAIEFQVLDALGSLREFGSLPAGASIEYQLDAGSHQVLVSRAGGPHRVLEIALDPGQVRSVDLAEGALAEGVVELRARGALVQERTAVLRIAGGERQLVIPLRTLLRDAATSSVALREGAYRIELHVGGEVRMDREVQVSRGTVTAVELPDS